MPGEEASESAFLRWLKAQPLEEQEKLLAQHSLIQPAHEFIRLVWGEEDLRSAWPLTDPLLRTCLAQRWLLDNERDLQESPWEPSEVVAAFVSDRPDHDLWSHFERVHLRGFRNWDDLTEWGWGTNTRLHSPGVEVLILLPPGITSWEPGEVQRVYPVLMRHDVERGWRVLNIGSENVPEAGWPPRL